MVCVLECICNRYTVSASSGSGALHIKYRKNARFVYNCWIPVPNIRCFLHIHDSQEKPEETGRNCQEYCFKTKINVICQSNKISG